MRKTPKAQAVIRNETMLFNVWQQETSKTDSDIKITNSHTEK